MNVSNANEDCPADLIPTRSSLLGRLKDWDDQESWRAFFNTYWRLIYNFALQRGLNHEEAQEAVQETVLAVAKSIGNFRYDRQVCAFKTWLLRVTCSKIANQFARRARHAHGIPDSPSDQNSAPADLGAVPDDHTNPWEQQWDEEWRRNLMEAALRRVKDRVSIEQYQMFDLFVNKEVSAQEVARTLKVTIGHVYVAKHRISRLIRKEIEALEKKGI